ncbi:cytochrome C [Maritimibacter sp. 55A14]|uniref:c-type cytochrome n=1 Tax=Maritimibacter sp. 55A14 TaxID=2174844 RepID=UPI000D60A678|nr:c-type cytochrome [Maritimibacter sp. 55A14]PWE29851.1 cytochrome C [Maritimibacter sp. 55A14]
MHKTAIIIALVAAFGTDNARADGNVERGAVLYRACVACHALEPGLHLTGPSLGGIWNRAAGEAAGFTRYSENLRGAGFQWNRAALDGWLENPAAMIEGTTMVYAGLPDPAARADLIAFLERAGQPGGAEALVAEGVIPAGYLRAQAPQPVHDAPAHARVIAMRHCGDGYEIETADGVSSLHWEKNIRLKIDSTETGPPDGTGVVLPAGMRGDRFSVIFASLADLERIVTTECADGEESRP